MSAVSPTRAAPPAVHTPDARSLEAGSGYAHGGGCHAAQRCVPSARANRMRAFKSSSALPARSLHAQLRTEAFLGALPLTRRRQHWPQASHRSAPLRWRCLLPRCALCAAAALLPPPARVWPAPRGAAPRARRAARTPRLSTARRHALRAQTLSPDARRSRRRLLIACHRHHRTRRRRHRGRHFRRFRLASRFSAFRGRLGPTRRTPAASSASLAIGRMFRLSPHVSHARPVNTVKGRGDVFATFAMRGNFSRLLVQFPAFRARRARTRQLPP